jgi:hypothetical protein
VRTATVLGPSRLAKGRREGRKLSPSPPCAYHVHASGLRLLAMLAAFALQNNCKYPRRIIGSLRQQSAISTSAIRLTRNLGSRIITRRRNNKYSPARSARLDYRLDILIGRANARSELNRSNKFDHRRGRLLSCERRNVLRPTKLKRYRYDLLIKFEIEKGQKHSKRNRLI